MFYMNIDNEEEVLTVTMTERYNQFVNSAFPDMPIVSKSEQDTSKVLRDLRDRLALSQCEFASRLHVPVQTYSQWETGRRTPPDYVIDMIITLVDQSDKIREITGSGKNIGHLSEDFSYDIAALGCPIPFSSRVGIVKTENEWGEAKYYITVGEIASGHVKPMLKWLDSNVDEEYVEEFGIGAQECYNAGDDVHEFCRKMIARKRHEWLIEREIAGNNFDK